MKLHCTEWSRISGHGLGSEIRVNIASLVEAWSIANNTPSPLWFTGTAGQEICTRQFVGVVEFGDVTLEIFPKLDGATLASASGQLASDANTDTVMSNLMWMLDVAEHRSLLETSTAHLEEEPTSFIDLFAYLLGKNLLPELERGLPHSYVQMEGDLTNIRGRIGVLTQVTKNWSRYDRVYCEWDEFTPDNRLNQVLKCACRYLRDRVKFTAAARLLADCEALLIDVEDVSPVLALREAFDVRFDRVTERFRASFNLARRLLAGIGHNLGVGDSNTFVFLIDMNQLFESYVHAVLESHFDSPVEKQVNVGTLLRLPIGGIRQVADFLWGKAHDCWIGDAKYKHLSSGYNGGLRFQDLAEEDSASDVPDVLLAGQVLSSADLRQLTVYAELVRLRNSSSTPPRLMLLYPFVGDPINAQPDAATAWNGSEFWLVPVLVKRQVRVGDAIRVLPANA